jgi:hypothetical protein
MFKDKIEKNQFKKVTKNNNNKLNQPELNH